MPVRDGNPRRGVGSKERLRRFLRRNIGRVVGWAELYEASGRKSQFSRRIRELREQEGWRILSNNDRADLKPGEYLLEEEPPAALVATPSRPISARLRAQVLDRDGFTCQMCGLGAGEVDPTTDRKVRLHIGHIVDKSLGGKEEISNLRALCATCNQGAKNVTTEKPGTIWLKAQIRRADIASQRAIYDFLRQKFEGGG